MNIKHLRIGDPHAKVTNLEEMAALLTFALSTAKSNGCSVIEILGDLFHTHTILRLEVLEFWDYWLDQLSDHMEVRVLVGNHDQSGDYGKEIHALGVFKRRPKPALQIIDKPTTFGQITYVPYIHDHNKFIMACNEGGTSTVVCHATFEGSQFENGMYAPDGVNPEMLLATTIISGHVHSRQRFKTSKGQDVIYPGTARWDTNSDANHPKGLWVVEHAEDGSIVSEEFVDTSNVVSPIYQITWKEGEAPPAVDKSNPKARISVELVGSSDWVTKNKALLKGHVAVSTKITDKKSTLNRSAGNSLQDFVTNLYVTSVDREKLLKFLKEWGIV